MTDSKLKLNETSWRVVAHEERGVGGQTFAHLTMRCCRCDSTTAIVVPAWPGSTVAQEEPTVEPCSCVQVALKAAAEKTEIEARKLAAETEREDRWC